MSNAKTDKRTFGCALQKARAISAPGEDSPEGGARTRSLLRPFALRLRSDSGESLVESIVSFAVITVVLIAFAGFATLGSNLSAQAAQLDAAVSVPPATAAGTATVQIDGADAGVTVNVYGNEADVYRYEVQR